MAAEEDEMASNDEERRLLRWVAERGGPAATVSVIGRGGEIGLDNDDLPEMVETLASRGLVMRLDDGDVRLTAMGQALAELQGE